MAHSTELQQMMVNRLRQGLELDLQILKLKGNPQNDDVKADIERFK